MRTRKSTLMLVSAVALLASSATFHSFAYAQDSTSGQGAAPSVAAETASEGAQNAGSEQNASATGGENANPSEGTTAANDAQGQDGQQTGVVVVEESVEGSVPVGAAPVTSQSAPATVAPVGAAPEAVEEVADEEEVVMMEGIGGEAVEEEEVAVGAAPEKAAGDLETPDVVITGTQLERKIEDAPVRTQVIKKEQLEQKKARNVAEALSYTTGVRVETNCQNCGFSQLRLNGLEGSYTQVLIDGLPSFSGLAGVYGLEQLPTELIGRIEVVKGGGSSLYGPSAVAGVVNIVTRKPKENFASAIVSLDLIGKNATDLRVTSDAGLISDDGKLGAHLFVSSRHRDPVDINGDQYSEMTKLQELAGGANLMFTPLENMNLQVAFHAVREYRRGGDNTKYTDANGKIVYAIDKPPHDVGIAEELRTDRLQGEVRFKHKINEMLDYSLGYVISYTDRKSYYGGGGNLEMPDPKTAPEADIRKYLEDKAAALGAYGRTTNPLQIADAKLNISYDAWGPQVVTVGAQFTADKVDDQYVALDRVIDDTFTDFGFYVQHDWIFADWGESVIGARIDKASSLEKPIVSPRAALSLHFFDWLRTRTAFSMGFRAPQAFDEDLHVETVGGDAVLITNAPGLKPERSLSVAQQVTTDFHLSNGDELDFSINGYYTRLADAFDKKEEDKASTVELDKVRVNSGVTTVFGMELAMGYQSKYFAARAGWTLESAKNSIGKKVAGETYKQIMRTPNNYGYIDFLGKYAGFQGQTGMSFTGPMSVIHNDENGDPERVDTSPWFVEWNVNVGYAFQTMGSFVVEPFLGIRNILNSHQDYDKNESRDSTYVFGPSQPRTYFGGVRGTF